MNKVVLVPAPFAVIGENVTEKVFTGERKTGLFGIEKEVTKEVTTWRETGHSDCRIDDEKFAEDIAKATKELNDNGYKVVSIESVISGNWAWNADNGASWGIMGY